MFALVGGDHLLNLSPLVPSTRCEQWDAPKASDGCHLPGLWRKGTAWGVTG